MTLTGARSSVIGDAPEEGRPVFRSGDDSETTQTYRVDLAQVFSDRFQGGVSVPIVQREVSKPRARDGATRVGDVCLTAAYEALPEWSYSIWKPKGFVFLQTTIPTGRSIYDAKETGAVDATGRGFYTLALGALFLKTRGAWDAYSTPELHYSFTRAFDGSSGNDSLRISPRFGASVAVGIGYSPSLGSLRMGLRLQPVFSQSKRVESSLGKSETGGQQSWDVAFEASHMIGDSWTLLSSYTDQTLLGPTKNSTLSRTFALGLQRRWPR